MSIAIHIKLTKNEKTQCRKIDLLFNNNVVFSLIIERKGI
jgi:hypothetical protein